MFRLLGIAKVVESYDAPKGWAIFTPDAHLMRYISVAAFLFLGGARKSAGMRIANRLAPHKLF